jgi:hypothetical protein
VPIGNVAARQRCPYFDTVLLVQRLSALRVPSTWCGWYRAKTNGGWYLDSKLTFLRNHTLPTPHLTYCTPEKPLVRPEFAAKVHRRERLEGRRRLLSHFESKKRDRFQEKRSAL